MKCNSDKLLRIVLVLRLISLETARPQDIDIDGFDEERDHDKGCSYLHCKRGEVCVDRRFSCKKPPCPRMLFCARTKKDFARGPATCDFAHCTRGHVCVVKVRHCHWDQKCAHQIARCVSEKDYRIDPPSCAEYSCPAGDHCILKETDCANPPCQLSRNCEKSTDVQAWHVKCRSLNCPSEYECFLRKPEENCPSVPCDYIPDCTTTIVEDELRSEYCEGWICPRYQRCLAKPVGSCQGTDCDIVRSCHTMPIQNEPPLGPRHSGIAEETALHQLSGRMSTIYTTSEEFQDWLDTVKATLGPDTYNRWLDYIHHSVNSEWIPIPRSILSVGPRRTLNVGPVATDAESVKESLSESREIRKSDTAPSLIVISNFERQPENNNGSGTDCEYQCTNSKFHCNNCRNESESNGVSDESLDRLNVSELSAMINQVISILNSPSVDADDAIKNKEIITRDNPFSSNIEPSESQEKIMHPVFSPNVLTRAQNFDQLPGQQNGERTGLNYSTTSECYRFLAKTPHHPDKLTERHSSSLTNKLQGGVFQNELGLGYKRKMLSFFKSRIDSTKKMANTCNVTDCAVQQFYESNQTNIEGSNATDMEVLLERRLENESISRTDRTVAAPQPSFHNEEQIPRITQLIYKDEQAGPRAAYHTPPSYGDGTGTGTRYNENSSYANYEFYNPPHGTIDTTNANLDT